MEELVFAVPTIDLWNLLTYKETGLIKGNGDDLNNLVRLGRFRKRSELEEDPSYKQLISYAVISCQESYLLFTRTAGQTERRLHHKLHLGVGGHMNPGDSKMTGEEYVMTELRRELFEEVKLLNSCIVENIEFIGFINDDAIPVGRMHTGLFFNIRLSAKDIEINEKDKMTAEWIGLADLLNYYEEMETWSRIIIDQYLK